jgi:hypothetical protein
LGSTTVSKTINVKKPSSTVTITLTPIIYNQGQTVKGFTAILDPGTAQQNNLGLFQADATQLTNGCSAGGVPIKISVDKTLLAAGTHVIQVTMVYCDNSLGATQSYTFTK